MRRYTTLRAGPETGQALVVVAMAMVVLLSMGALSIDFAFLTVARDELQRAADAAALAGAAQIGTDEEVSTAIEFAAKNTVAGQSLTLTTSDVDVGSYDFESEEFDDFCDPGSENAVRVTAGRTASSPNGALPLFFATLFGMSTADVTAQAIAVLDRRVSGIDPRSGAPLVPFLVHADSLGGIDGGVFDPPVGSQVEFYPERGGAPGNFGLADLDGGGGGVPELRDWIENGYPGPIDIPPGPGYLIVGGSPGLKNGIRSSVWSRVGDTAVVLVYDQVTGEGANSQFRVKNFCAVQITGARLIGSMSSRYIHGTVVKMTSENVNTSAYGMTNTALGVLRLVQ